jgi:hypothetical protein
MRRLALVPALLAWGCSPSAVAPPVSGNDAGSADSGDSCGLLVCFPDPAEASLPVRAKARLDGCRGSEFCHGANAGGMTLLLGGEFDATIDVRSTERPDLVRVQPGEPLQSYLYLKVLCEGGFEGGCMSGDPNVVQLFHDWIEAGAPTN